PNHPSNWALSTARAVSIVEYFIEAGIAPERLTASGRAGFDPIYPNDTEEHRAFNRRADIIIVYPVESQIFDLGIDVELLDHLTSGPMDPGGETNP
ncbi:MAG TPA: OmpA family protein, partial [Chloroflexi bacterium]|nr:OmpA family protein [Chloroflexota bacterium]